MKRFAVVLCAVAAATSLVASPSFGASNGSSEVAGAGDERSLESGVQAPASIAAAVDPKADKRASQLRDKMPFFSQEPTVVGDSLVFTVDVSPMREKDKKGSALLDRIGGNVEISRVGVDVRKPGSITAENAADTLLVSRVLPERTVTKAGDQSFRVRLPKSVAADLRRLSPTQLRQRVKADIWNDKDTNAGGARHDRRQGTTSWMVSSYRTYLESRRPGLSCGTKCSTVNSAAVERRAMRSMGLFLPAKPPPESVAGTVVVYNGSPFDIDIAINPVQCMIPAIWDGGPPTNPPTLPANSSYEFFQATQITGNQYYTASQSVLEQSAKDGMDSLQNDAFVSLERAAYLKHITQSFSRGLIYFGSSMAFDITLGMVSTLIAKSNACTNAGSAYNISWTNTNIGGNQTAGNVNYWAPSYSRTVGMGSPQVSPTSIPDLAPGSPLSAYNATSQNGLAVDYSTLLAELGFGGSVNLATLNSSQRNGSYSGYWCNFRNQQMANPNASGTGQFGSSALGGGSSMDWGPCLATAATGSPDWIASEYGISGGAQGNIENTGMSILIGYSSTANVTAGPSPAEPPVSAASATACTMTKAPCIYTIPTSAASPNLTVGCTPGSWNLMTPWNGSNINLSSPPNAYQASSTMSTQIAFTGFTASGTPITNSIPVADGGNVASSFAPNAVNPFTFSPGNLASIQASLGGPGGYVTNWLCVMTANVLVPSGVSTVSPSAVAMNLGWYGKPVVAYAPNPAGNLLSPPATSSVASPIVSSVSPVSGSTAGGTSITITGTGFVSGATVTVGGAACTSVVVGSGTSLTCTTPAGSAGVQNIVVTNPAGLAGMGTGLFTFVAPPTVTGVAPSVGSTAGGTSITITGTGFVSGATVTVGGAPCTSVVVGSATSVSCTTPAGSAGAQNLVVTNPAPSLLSGTGTGAFTYA
jgi:hypothetical protein